MMNKFENKKEILLAYTMTIKLLLINGGLSRL